MNVMIMIKTAAYWNVILLVDHTCLLLFEMHHMIIFGLRVFSQFGTTDLPSRLDVDRGVARLEEGELVVEADLRRCQEAHLKVRWHHGVQNFGCADGGSCKKIYPT